MLEGIVSGFDPIILPKRKSEILPVKFKGCEMLLSRY